MVTDYRLINSAEPYPEQPDILPKVTDIIYPYMAIELIFEGGRRTQLFTAGKTQLYGDFGKVIKNYTRESHGGLIEGPFIQIHAGTDNFDTLAFSEFLEAVTK